MDAAVMTTSPTVAEALEIARRRLLAAGVSEARADAEVLLAYALGTTRTGLVLAARRALDGATASAFEALVARREAREPLQHLTGTREFWSLDFAVDRRALVPRPETEVVVETALALGARARSVLDVGTGSGVVATVLARELPAATVWASDVDAEALALARSNTGRLAPRVRLLRADLLGAFRDDAFDLVVSNPPYVGEDELRGLAPEVRDHEPRRALVAGADGLAVLRALVGETPRVLRAGGWLVMEVGAGQAPAVRDCIARAGRYGAPRTVCDPAGIERVVAAERHAEERGRTWTAS